MTAFNPDGANSQAKVKVLSFMEKQPVATLSEIKQGVQSRQAGIPVALKRLREAGVVRIAGLRHVEGNRPAYVYELSGEPDVQLPWR